MLFSLIILSILFNLNIQGYCVEHLFGNKAPNTTRGRYSGGISIYFKSKLNGKITIVDKHQIGIVWLKICKSVFHFDEDVYICCTYIPPRESSILTQGNINIFDLIEHDIERYKSLGKVLTTGDFNCRTSDEPDFIIFDRFLDDNSLPPTLDAVQRINKDHVLDAHGKRLTDLCKTTNLLIANGRLHNDNIRLPMIMVRV